MFPKIKKSISKFFLDESGQSPKQKILSMGLLSFALSATAVQAANIKWVKYDCIAKEGDRLTVDMKIRNERNEEGKFHAGFKVSLDDLKLVGVVRDPGAGLDFINPPAEEEYSASFDSHVSDDNGNCHVSNHFSADESDGCVVDIPDLYLHKNELVLESSDQSVVVAKHFHDIEATGGSAVCHVSDHWSQSDSGGGLCRGDETDHVNSEPSAGWINCDGFEEWTEES